MASCFPFFILFLMSKSLGLTAVGFSVRMVTVSSISSSVCKGRSPSGFITAEWVHLVVVVVVGPFELPFVVDRLSPDDGLMDVVRIRLASGLPTPEAHFWHVFLVHLFNQQFYKFNSKENGNQH